jgi:hypothetical protein
MTTMGHLKKLSGVLAVIALSVSCGDVVRQGKSSVFLVLDLLEGQRGAATPEPPTTTLLSDVLTYVRTPAPCTTTSPCPTIFNDLGIATLRLSAKDITNATGPTTNNQVTINRYHVSYRRADGRNTMGVDVPYAFDGAATGTVPASGKLELGFELVRHMAKEESPLVQLVNGPTIITTIADVTFYGRDQVGNDISVSGSIQIDFGNFGDK